VKQYICLKIKNVSQNILTNFFASRVCSKTVIFNVLLVIKYALLHVFNKKNLFRAAEKGPPPHRAEQEVGKYWLFSATSRGFGLCLKAVRIRVN
jgi:hypothetical protein